MHLEHRVVIVTPAGRKRYMQLLVPQILALRPVVDEYRIWVNTTVAEDLAYFDDLQREYPDFITLKHLPPGVKAGTSDKIYNFFVECTEETTVYVRFDDDIVYMEGIEAFKGFVAFRIEHPEHFIVYGNILNNAVSSHFHQKEGRLQLSKPVTRDCLCPAGWRDPLIAEEVHRAVLKSPSLADFHCPPRVLSPPYRVSINCISWLGARFRTFGGQVHWQEEESLAVRQPQFLGLSTCIYGDFVCVHFAFHTQRDHLDTTTLLSEYEHRIASDLHDRRA